MIVPGNYSVAFLTVLEGSLIDHELMMTAVGGDLKNVGREAVNRKVT